MELTTTLTLDAAQEAGLDYVTNLANQSLPPDQQLTPEQYAAAAFLGVINSYTAQRASVRIQYGLSLYSNANPATKAVVDQELGLPADYPTGKEGAQ